MNPHTGSAAVRRDALAERLFESVLGLIDIHMVYLGDQLGLYRELAKSAASAGELAVRTGTEERYVREWLEQQAVSGLVDVDDAGLYVLPEGHAEVLVDRDDPAYFAAFARMMVGIVRPLPQVLDAFRSGGGVPYAAFDADFCDGQGEMNRVMFINLLGSQWLPSVSDVHARLMSDPPARVADVACGTGWSSLAVADAYPKVVVDGIDVDKYSIEVARRNAAGAALDDRVHFECRDAADPALEGLYDLVTIFEAVHDMSHPVEALGAVRGLLAEGGSVIVADERVAEQFTAPGDEVERVMYGFSVLHCLPTAMVDADSAATGTAMRPDTMREYATAAGFTRFEILPIENDFWRFYRLWP